MTDRIHLTPPLRRAAELELERNRRSGRSFSLVLIGVHPGTRARRAVRALHTRLRAVADQHVRPFDHVDVLPAAGLLVVVAHDTDAEAAERIADRLSVAVERAGGSVAGTGAATFPHDGLLLSHLLDRAAQQLDASDATVGAASTGTGR